MSFFSSETYHFYSREKIAVYCIGVLWSCTHIVTLVHYANTPMQYTAIFHGCKNVNFQMIFFLNIFLIFASKQRLWALVRTASVGEAVLTSAHNLCFEAKIRKKCIPKFYS